MKDYNKKLPHERTSRLTLVAIVVCCITITVLLIRSYMVEDELNKQVSLSEGAKLAGSRVVQCTDSEMDGLCNRSYKPVCGSDGRTYNNDCLVCARMGETKEVISVVSEAACKPVQETDVLNTSVLPETTKSGNRVLQCTDSEMEGLCDRSFRPVCGSDGRTYNNDCLVCARMGQTKEVISVVSEAACKPVEEIDMQNKSVSETTKSGNRVLQCTDSEMDGLCDRSFRPVCGSDGRTYNNDCLVCARMGETKEVISVVSEAACEPVEMMD